MINVAVTGSGGLIGSRLCADLARDHEVVRIDVKGVEEAVDTRDLGAFEAAVAGCETLIHLARIGRIRGSVNPTWEDMQDNLTAAYNAFEAARRQGCKRVIFASSNHAVGMYEIRGEPHIFEPKNGTLIDARVAPRPDGLYGVWKLFGEALGRYYSDKYGLQVACLRIGNVQEDAAKDAGELVRSASSLARGTGSSWATIDAEAGRKRMAAMYLSHRDLAGLVRAIMRSDVPYGIVYGVSDNATRFYDLEEARRLYGFWPVDGIK